MNHRWDSGRQDDRYDDYESDHNPVRWQAPPAENMRYRATPTHQQSWSSFSWLRPTAFATAWYQGKGSDISDALSVVIKKTNGVVTYPFNAIDTFYNIPISYFTWLSHFIVLIAILICIIHFVTIAKAIIAKYKCQPSDPNRSPTLQQPTTAYADIGVQTDLGSFVFTVDSRSEIHLNPTGQVYHRRDCRYVFPRSLRRRPCLVCRPDLCLGDPCTV